MKHANIKNIWAILAMTALLLPATSNAQDRLRERDLEGTTWKMVFDFDNDREKKEADNAFERIILSAVDGFMDEIDIYFEFGRRGNLTVWVNVFGDEDEEEGSDWRISSDGHLEMGETDSFQYDDTVWLRYGDRLIPFERKRGGRLERENSVYLKRVD
jgi:hypothetical protein